MYFSYVQCRGHEPQVLYGVMYVLRTPYIYVHTKQCSLQLLLDWLASSEVVGQCAP